MVRGIRGMRMMVLLLGSLMLLIHVLGVCSVCSYEELREDAEEVYEWMVDIRRQLHRHPEVMYQEYRTSELIQNTLQALNIPYTTGWAKNKHPHIFPGAGATGVVAEIGTGEPPCVALRADIDALPINEITELEFRSEVPGKMHACGHDGHTSMLLGAAKILKAREATINGTIRLIFQPAEEGGAGGERMREEGVLSAYPPVSRIFGFHVWPSLPSGVLGGRPGPLLAAADTFEAVISGVGGHAAMPQSTVDPIIAAAHIVTSLQAIVSREISPLESGVVSVTKIHGGDAFNVIPDAVSIGGTLRSLSLEGLDVLRTKLNRVVEGTAHAHGCNVTINYMPDPYPPTVNDAEAWNFVRRVAAVASDNGTVVDLLPSMGAEDFAFFARTVPGAFIVIGQGSGEFENAGVTSHGVHNPRFKLHERVMKTGAALHAHLALQSLQELQQPESSHAFQVKVGAA